MAGVSLNTPEVALFTNKKKNLPRGRNGGKTRGNVQPKGAQQKQQYNNQQSKNFRRQNGKCFHCGKKGHYARDCWSKKKTVQSNAATTSNCHQDEPKWDVEALFMETMQVEECSSSEIVEVLSFIATTIEVEEE